VTRITHFSSRKALDVPSLGESVAEALVREDLCRSPLDLFALTLDQLGPLNLGSEEEPRRFGEKNAQKVLDGLEEARHKPLKRWLYAMGIRQLGESAATEISRLILEFRDIPNNQLLQKIAERGLKDAWVKKFPAAPKKEKITDEEKKRRAKIAKEYRDEMVKLNEDLKPFCINSELGGVAAQNVLLYFESEAGIHALSQLELYEINPISDNYDPIPDKISKKPTPKFLSATNRQKKILNFFKVTFSPKISVGAAGWEIAGLMANEDNRNKWKKYLYITKDYDDESPNPAIVDTMELENTVIPDDWNLSDERQDYLDKIVNLEMSDGSPFDNPTPEINFEGFSFIFTGKFEFGSREECQEAVVKRGGIAPSQKSISRSIDYLVIGSGGSTSWKRGSYGNKIEAAIISRRLHGTPAIISESDWLEQLTNTP
jgi:NAD-dependent DNA ligase